MFETLYLTETTGAEIVIQRVPGGYIWREWSKEQGQVNGFNSVFVKWDNFFIGDNRELENIFYCEFIKNKTNNQYYIYAPEYVNDINRNRFYGIYEKDYFTDWGYKPNVFENHIEKIATYNYNNRNLQFNGELE